MVRGRGDVGRLGGALRSATAADSRLEGGLGGQAVLVRPERDAHPLSAISHGASQSLPFGSQRCESSAQTGGQPARLKPLDGLAAPVVVVEDVVVGLRPMRPLLAVQGVRRGRRRRRQQRARQKGREAAAAEPGGAFRGGIPSTAAAQDRQQAAGAGKRDEDRGGEHDSRGDEHGQPPQKPTPRPPETADPAWVRARLPRARTRVVSRSLRAARDRRRSGEAPDADADRQAPRRVERDLAERQRRGETGLDAIRAGVERIEAHLGGGQPGAVGEQRRLVAVQRRAVPRQGRTVAAQGAIVPVEPGVLPLVVRLASRDAALVPVEPGVRPLVVRLAGRDAAFVPSSCSFWRALSADAWSTSRRNASVTAGSASRPSLPSRPASWMQT